MVRAYVIGTSANTLQKGTCAVLSVACQNPKHLAILMPLLFYRCCAQLYPDGSDLVSVACSCDVLRTPDAMC